jgi:DNA-binding transcriptional LysR family regulator
VAPSIAFEATTLESACSAVAARLGVAFVGESLARIFAMPGVAYRPFAAPPPMSKLGVAWRQDATSNTVRWFLEILDELAATNGNGGRHSARAPVLAGRPGRSPGLSWPDGEPG